MQSHKLYIQKYKNIYVVMYRAYKHIPTIYTHRYIYIHICIYKCILCIHNCILCMYIIYYYMCKQMYRETHSACYQSTLDE